MQEARDLADKLFAHFGVEPILVQRTQRRDAYGSWFWHPWKGRPARIHLSNEAPDWIVCHEVAHYVAWDSARQLADDGFAPFRNPGHGREWATVYVEAVRVAISEHYAHRLRLAMGRNGIDVLDAED